LTLKTHFGVEKYPLPLGYLIPNVSARFYSLLLLKRLIDKDTQIKITRVDSLKDSEKEKDDTTDMGNINKDKEVIQLKQSPSPENAESITIEEEITSKSNIESIFFEKHESQTNSNKEPTQIIDLGVGANCIFPLLAAKGFNWKVLGFENNPKSFELALETVTQNNLQSQIQLELNTNYDKLILDYFNKQKETSSPDFFEGLICNPPFYLNFKDFKKRKRKGFTAKPHEVLCDGGEVTFGRRLVAESLLLRKRVGWFCLYLSEKSSMFNLKRTLKTMGSIESVVNRVIPLGKNKRFFLAWKFKSG
jgi:23S rRNA A1618 N6-methylase RlmF